MDINLTISLNGEPKAKEEMRQYVFENETISRIINDVKKRVEETRKNPIQ